MNSSNYRFMLDLHSTQSQISIPVTQGDTARTFLISFADGGLPYIIEDGCLAMISIKRPTGTYLEAFCAIEKNTTVRFDFSQNENAAAVPGIHDCSVTLYDAEGAELGSPRFTMVVSDKVVNRDDINLSDEDISAIDAMISAEASRQAAETSRVNAEAARGAAETSRVSAETARVSAESARGTAESARASAESARDTAEKARDTAEKGRVATLRQIQESIAAGRFDPIYSSVTLRASAWSGSEDPYSQVVSITGVTAKSKVDLLPSVEQLAIFHEKDVTFITENDGGVVTVFAIGDKPTRDYTIEVCITEVRV